MSLLENRANKSIKKIACIGEVMVELSIDPKNSDHKIGYAGDSYNTAIYLSRGLAGTNQRVEYITALGEDDFSRKILSSLEEESIGTASIEIRADKNPGLYAISTDDAGERSFQYWRNDSAARTLFQEPATITLASLQQYDVIYFSSITLAVLAEDIRQALLDRLIELRAAGVIVVFDSNYRPKLWQDKATAQKWVADMWRITDIALPSVDDEMALFDDANEQAVVSRLHSYGISYGALKRGAEGPLPLTLGSDIAQQYPAAEKVVDTTAAGDSFNAGFLSAFVRGEELASCLMRGHQLAAEVIGFRGAIIPK